MSRKPKSNRCGFMRPVLTCLPLAPHDNGKLSGSSSFCPFGKVLRFLLAQIILGSDDSGPMKELQ